MKDDLQEKIRKNYSIVNLAISSESGTHWIAYIKKNNTGMYFDSYRNLISPSALEKYFHSDDSLITIKYSQDKYQRDNATNCGQLCLNFLYNGCN